jgi:hypothetical protein
MRTIDEAWLDAREHAALVTDYPTSKIDKYWTRKP